MSYGAFVALGVVAALVATRLLPPDDAVPARVALRVRGAALVGGIVGAYLGEWPARALGLSAAGEHAGPIGRTVLGGLLVGWFAVEGTKRALGHRGATGDRFALPLALGLAFGRFGCLSSGCCLGRPVDPDSLAGRIGTVLHGAPRFPATYVEACFHAGAALVLVLLHRADRARGVRLAGYLASYALLRFVLEFRREAPPALAGLTYYQWLAVALFLLAFGTFVARIVPARGAADARPVRAFTPSRSDAPDRG